MYIIYITYPLLLLNDKVVSFFEEMGFDRPTIGKILCRSPEIFAGHVENTLRRKIRFLIDFGFSNEKIPRIVKKYPEFILLDTNETLQPRYAQLILVAQKWDPIKVHITY
jgi:mTERF domain-containing protein, mitochondrial